MSRKGAKLLNCFSLLLGLGASEEQDHNIQDSSTLCQKARKHEP